MNKAKAANTAAQKAYQKALPWHDGQGDPVWMDVSESWRINIPVENVNQKMIDVDESPNEFLGINSQFVSGIVIDYDDKSNPFQKGQKILHRGSYDKIPWYLAAELLFAKTLSRAGINYKKVDENAHIDFTYKHPRGYEMTIEFKFDQYMSRDDKHKNAFVRALTSEVQHTALRQKALRIKRRNAGPPPHYCIAYPSEQVGNTIFKLDFVICPIDIVKIRDTTPPYKQRLSMVTGGDLQKRKVGAGMPNFGPPGVKAPKKSKK